MRFEEGPFALRFLKLVLTAWWAALLVSAGAAAASQPLHADSQSSEQRPAAQTSWGLGLVLPEGSALSGGGTVNWTSVTNVTAVVQLPDLTNVTAATYAVLSVMTRGGAVLQTAFGVYPGERSWLVYSMFITNIGQVPQRYTWAANASEPDAHPGDIVAISIYLPPGTSWSFRASNLNTSMSVWSTFGANTSDPPKVGDQEVFALESYANSSAILQSMGNMTLLSLSINGQHVVSGWYLFSGWDMVHNPLFVVGGGPTVPLVYVATLPNGSVVWYYSGNWQDLDFGDAEAPTLVAASILLGAVVATVLLSFRTRRSK